MGCPSVSTLTYAVSVLCVFNCLLNVDQARAANATTDPAEGLSLLLMCTHTRQVSVCYDG